MKPWLILLLCLLPLPLTAADEPCIPLFESHYSLYAMGLKIGEGVRRLQRQADGRFLFESDSQTSGLLAMFRDDRIYESSLWRWQDGWIQPLEYTYRHSGTRKQRDVHIRFDWDARLAYNTHKGKTWKLELSNGALDKLVYQLMLMHQLAEDKRDIAYTIADGGKLKKYRVDFAGEETLDTKLGKLKTLKFIRIDHANRMSALWCAPALAYLPVRVEHKEPKGEKITLLIEKVTGIRLEK